MQQFISPARKIFFVGDRVTIKLTGIGGKTEGKAVLRTNLGRAAEHRLEMMLEATDGIPVSGLDWNDIELVRDGDTASVTLGLPEVGVFEAKCCFIPSDGSPIIWAENENFFLKVEAAESVCGNSIYSAFVRQFGAGMERESSGKPDPSEAVLDDLRYTVIPPGGTFRQLIARLDHIFGEMHCRILQLLPIHPIPTQYGKMGRFGSPFAALDYFNVDPGLADFDETATPMEQFCELIDEVHARHGRIMMDIPVNHTGWASKLQTEHPDYFVREKDGRFVSPGAWGVVWADLCRLDYQNPRVTEMMAEVFLFWCRRGVNGFRCDAGYMVPEKAWNFIVGRVRSEFPDTIFLLEGLGGPPDVQERLLGVSGLDWAYSELFQNYSRDQISGYFPYMLHVARNCGAMVSFAETHDNLRLAATSKRYAKVRFLVCGLMALDGAFGFANGAEFFATEKIDVHGCGALNFGASFNLIDLIRRINDCHTSLSAFASGAELSLIQRGGGNVIALRRVGVDGKRALVLINLDCDNPATVSFAAEKLPQEGLDVLSDKVVRFEKKGDHYCYLLPAGEGVCVSFDENISGAAKEPLRILRQRASAMAQRLAFRMKGFTACGEVSGEELMASPLKFAERLTGISPAPVTVWNADCRDENREVMIPSSDALFVRSCDRFHCTITDHGKCIASCESIPGQHGEEFILIALLPNTGTEVRILDIEVCRFPAGKAAHRYHGTLWQLPQSNSDRIEMVCDTQKAKICQFFAADKRGGYTLFPADWRNPDSKYNALLAVNWEKRYPTDRKVIFSNFKAWLVVNDFSQEINGNSLLKFVSGYDRCGKWLFFVPAGQGRRTQLEVTMAHSEENCAVKISFFRPSTASDALLADDISVKLIIRPELENRVNHELTKAYQGAEHIFPHAVHARDDGFGFCGIDFRFPSGNYRNAPEWHYCNQLPLEAHYGQDCQTDRFSPGYFEAELFGEDCVELTVAIAGEKPVFEMGAEREYPTLREIEKNSLDAFIVRRDDLSTVIAGYPWFLDWGRDTLIVLRGLLKCGFVEESAKIICAFARFEKNGTIPNMIRGNDDANRDTSDAPLYLVIAARDYVQSTGDQEFLSRDCGSGRTLGTVLRSIIQHYREGTPNGIKMDEESKLVFSPVHFTWMDTNYPAGTPREGYPIEIQSLWYAALKFLRYDELAAKVSASIEKLFFCEERAFASDCLHCRPGESAARAVPDDHLRSNQLLALTLDAVKTPALREKILFSCAELLVPGGIRTLADRDVCYELPIDFHGRRLNDARHPYRGRYEGDEDHCRKVAYHNGTVWCWPFPAYCEALYLMGGEAVRERALALLLSGRKYLETGVLGQIPEVADGDAPHHMGGCIAQAWSTSEFFRVYEILAQNQ
ncbi:MAG: glycogen debranching enzyme N-terminal domain-containing protein [Victivallaceae bacterium]|nr:glycogen debranching enzyme N-terminal domain-containing protein [Victivallaceae bacterium]